MIYQFSPVKKVHRALVHEWLSLGHVREWYYGQGLKNTLNHLDKFLEGDCDSHYWLAFDGQRPFAFLITSFVSKSPSDELARFCSEEGKAITLDLLIGDIAYLGKGLAPRLIQEFLQSQFPDIAEVLIDPEIANLRAIHVYEKVGFKRLEEFIPKHNPKPHLMMHLNMSDL